MMSRRAQVRRTKKAACFLKIMSMKYRIARTQTVLVRIQNTKECPFSQVLKDKAMRVHFRLGHPYVAARKS